MCSGRRGGAGARHGGEAVAAIHRPRLVGCRAGSLLACSRGSLRAGRDGRPRVRTTVLRARPDATGPSRGAGRIPGVLLARRMADRGRPGRGRNQVTGLAQRGLCLHPVPGRRRSTGRPARLGQGHGARVLRPCRAAAEHPLAGRAVVRSRHGRRHGRIHRGSGAAGCRRLGWRPAAGQRNGRDVGARPLRAAGPGRPAGRWRVARGRPVPDGTTQAAADDATGTTPALAWPSPPRSWRLERAQARPRQALSRRVLRRRPQALRPEPRAPCPGPRRRRLQVARPHGSRVPSSRPPAPR